MSKNFNNVQFGNDQKQLLSPFVIYGDFECYLKGIYKFDKGSSVYYTDKYQ